jgi:hypothetical protein
LFASWAKWILNFLLFFVEDIPLCLLNWKTTKQFLVSIKHNNILHYSVLMLTYFSHLTIIRPSLQT